MQNSTISRTANGPIPILNGDPSIDEWKKILGKLSVAAAAMAQTPPPAVLVATAELRDITPATEFVGRVKATDRVEIRARVTGFLGPRLFKDGDLVTEGQVLFKLDSAPFEAVVQQKQATVQSAEASVQLADLQSQRSRELVRTNAAPQSQVDQRDADLTRAKADLALAHASLRPHHLLARLPHGQHDAAAVHRSLDRSGRLRAGERDCGGAAFLQRRLRPTLPGGVSARGPSAPCPASRPG